MYKSDFPINHHAITPDVQYRFAEIELAFAVNVAQDLFIGSLNPRQKAITMLYDIVVPPTMREQVKEEEFQNLFLQQTFLYPTKEELTYYLKAHRMPYTRIQKIANVAPNYISKMRFTEPVFKPLFPKWNTVLLHCWNNSKKHLNIFKEELAHMTNVMG